MNRPSYLAQMRALCRKNYWLYRKNWIINLIRALILPVVYFIFLGYSRNLTMQPSKYGVGTPQNLEPIQYSKLHGTFVWINTVKNRCSNSLMQRIQASLPAQMGFLEINDENELSKYCVENYIGVSDCIGAVNVLECELGANTTLNYNLRYNYGYGKTFIASRNSDSVKYLLPLQQAVDNSFLELTGNTPLPNPNLLVYTRTTENERWEYFRHSYLYGMHEIIIIAFSVVYMAVVFQTVGSIVEERENLCTNLLTSMGCRQFSRFFSWILCTTVLYMPGWIMMSIVIKKLVFSDSSMASLVFFHAACGLMMVGWSVFASNFFKRTMLSSIVSVIAAFVMIVVAQNIKESSNVRIILLGLLFPPMLISFGYFGFTDYEMEKKAISWLNKANFSDVPFILIFFLIIMNAIMYPLIAMYFETVMYGLGGFKWNFRGVAEADIDEYSGPIISIKNLTKIYSFGSKLPFFRRKLVTAVNDLSIDINRGEIFCLLGANGTGKSTTMAIISGMQKKTKGSIKIGPYKIEELPKSLVSICPQKNVLWEKLTVYQHLKIWKDIKPASDAPMENIEDLVIACDLSSKRNKISKNLSGGQKRKLQLAIAYIGGSKICLIDEASSGLDPLSRQTIWDVIRKYRSLGKTIVLTTHYLDEAEELGDSIAILEYGKLMTFGTVNSLKAKHGGDYDLTLVKSYSDNESDTRRTEREYTNEKTILMMLKDSVSDAEQVWKTPYEISYSVGRNVDVIIKILRNLEVRKQELGFSDFFVTAPSLESVFLKCIDSETSSSNASKAEFDSGKELEDELKLAKNPDEFTKAEKLETKQSLDLISGKSTSIFLQIWSLLKKRWWLFKKGQWKIALYALLAATLTSGLSTFYLKNYTRQCTTPYFTLPPIDLNFPAMLPDSEVIPIIFGNDVNLLLSNKNLLKVQNVVIGTDPNELIQKNGDPKPFKNPLSKRENPASKILTVYPVKSPDELVGYVNKYHKLLETGGVWFDSNSKDSLIAWNDLNYTTALSFMNVLTNLKYNLDSNQPNQRKIVTQMQKFSRKRWSDAMKGLKFLFFFAIALAVYPAFATLYVTNERSRKIRALHYSNGVRPLSIWTAYILYEIPLIILISIIITIVLNVTIDSSFYSHKVYFFVLVLYGISATLFAFLVSLLCKSSLAAFALYTVINAIFTVLYAAGVLLTITYAKPKTQQRLVKSLLYSSSFLAPTISSIHSIFMGLNTAGLACDINGQSPETFAILRLFGGPMLYCVLLGIVYYLLLIGIESGFIFETYHALIQRISKERDETNVVLEEEKAPYEKLVYTSSSHKDNVIEVRHLRKKFKKFKAIDDLSFSVGNCELYALLGPNGAGKTTTLGILRGEIIPTGGSAIVDGHDILKERNLARKYLGVCPQFDAFDELSVEKHLQFYALVKGVPPRSIKFNVDNAMNAVGIYHYRNQLAGRLSGGSQRKLSLAIALIGNPRVLLIDEASTGMDAGSKRIIWRAIKQIRDNRAIVMTTHSMEEASALSSRIGIMSGKMLSECTLSELRQKFLQGYTVSFALQDENYIKSIAEKLREWYPNIEQRSELHAKKLSFFIPFDSNSSVPLLLERLLHLQENYKFDFIDIAPTTLQDLFMTVVSKALKSRKSLERNYSKRY